jgi:hypothetical protein
VLCFAPSFKSRCYTDACFSVVSGGFGDPHSAVPQIGPPASKPAGRGHQEKEKGVSAASGKAEHRQKIETVLSKLIILKYHMRRIGSRMLLLI